MNSFFNFQFGEFYEVSPNWFDWFSLIATLLISSASILLAYYIAERIYSKEKKDKIEENNKLQFTENQLFIQNLKILETALTKQTDKLKEYYEKRNFKLDLNPNVHIEFLKFIDIKNLYLKIGFDNSESIKELNSIFTLLFTLDDFRESLTDEFRTYLKKYNYHERKFYSYRKLLYTKYYELFNSRTTLIKIEDGIKKSSFPEEDKFMPEYIQLRENILKDNSIIDNNGLKNRKNLNEKFVKELIHLTYKYIPEDFQAIEVNDLANEVNAGFIDMEYVTVKHFKVIKSYIDNLEFTHQRIVEYLDINTTDNKV